MKARNLEHALILTLLVFLVPAANADEDDGPADAGPVSNVARVSLIRGEISLGRGDSGDWLSAVVNTPLVIGDTVDTADDSRAEIQLDEAHVLRLDQDSQVKIANLTPSSIQLMLAQGRADFVTLRHSTVDVEIDMPNAAMHPFTDGVYCIQVNSDSETQLTVRRGEAEVSTPEGSITVGMDQLISVRGSEDAEYQIVEAPARDDWDEWNETRDHDILGAQSWRYANAAYTGASDLDGHGQWVQVPGYDWCWTPYVNLGWVPYSYGRWVWEPYWGWTWVSYEPWGWAPYHYGRWFFWGNGWVWWPGPRQPTFRPVWAPAYVSFFGFGFGGRSWSFGTGFGYQTIGWLPVGPSDPYYPWSGYRTTYNAVHIANITTVRNITNVNNVRTSRPMAPLAAAGQPAISNVQAAMNNESVRQAIVTAPTQDFERGVLPRNFTPVDVATLRQAQLVQGTLPAVPTRQSLRSVDRPTNPALVTARSTDGSHFFTRNQPPAGPRPFNEGAAEIRRMVQQANPAGPGANVGPNGARPNSAVKSSARASGEVGENERAATSRQTTAEEAERTSPATEENTGWRRFGPAQATEASSRGTTKEAGSEEREPYATPSSERGTVREEDLSPGVERPARETAKPERAAEEPTRPGWHRFGEAGSKSEPSKSPAPGGEHKSQPRGSGDKKDQPKK